MKTLNSLAGLDGHRECLRTEARFQIHTAAVTERPGLDLTRPRSASKWTSSPEHVTSLKFFYGRTSMDFLRTALLSHPCRLKLYQTLTVIHAGSFFYEVACRYGGVFLPG